MWLSAGRTTLGVTNLTENSTKGAFQPLFTAAFFKTLGIYLLSLSQAITNMAYPLAVMICAQNVDAIYTLDSSK